MKKARPVVRVADIRWRASLPGRRAHSSVGAGGYLSLSEAMAGRGPAGTRLFAVMCSGWCKPPRLVYFCPISRGEGVVIRCEQCLKIFCRKCARRHFKEAR